MLSFLHYTIHAVCLAVIATLLHQYLQIQEEKEILLYEGRQLYRHFLTTPQLQKELVEIKPTPVSERIGELKIEAENFEHFHSTSVWCSGARVSEKICQFTDLCYNSEFDEFIFFRDNSSIFENFNQSDANGLDLSSVAGHNNFRMRLTFLPASTRRQFSLNWINLTSLVFYRFKPDNLMHVFHDDIIPMHHTLELINLFDRNRQKFTKHHTQLVFLDESDVTDFKVLYELFTDVVPLYNSIRAQQGLLCFRRAFLGITKKTLWYDYGFQQPQRPLPNLQVSSYHIRNTFSFITKNLNQSVDHMVKKPFLVLVSRSANRLILNELELLMYIAQQTRVEVVSVDLDMQELTEVMSIISQSLGVIGMHGSLMILALALKPSSILIELFPYAVKPENYTPYKTLASLSGMDIVYRAWANQNVGNTVGHPDWEAGVGGISHLSLEKQSEIISQTEVPKHPCCDDPSWLYHIYQDTKVDVTIVTDLVVQALEEAKTFQTESRPYVFFPSKIIDVTCHRKELSVILSWSPPWNLPYLTFKKITYEMIFKYANEDNHIVYILKEPQHKISLQKLELFHVWIRCVLDDEQPGPFLYVDQC